MPKVRKKNDIIHRKTHPKREVKRMFIQLNGAKLIIDDDGNPTYEPRGPVIVNEDRIAAVYDHAVLIDGQKITVMEDIETLERIIKGSRKRF